MMGFPHAEHDDRGLSNVEVGWMVYFGLVIGLLIVLIIVPAVF